MTNNRGLSFITLMIVIAISALVLRTAIEWVIKSNISQNESEAQSTLKLIAASLDNYAKDHLGSFPGSLSVLTQDDPPYLRKDYINKSFLRGYDYSCPRLDATGYVCSATPARCALTGSKIYTITTGGSIVPDDCGKKD